VLPGWRPSVVLALAGVLPLALLLAAEAHIAGHAGLPLDDSWIHLHFARNLAEGAGFVYNPNVPVAGSTAPLWTLLLAAAVAIAGNSLAVVKGLGVAVTLAAAVATRAAALAWGASSGLALAAAVGLLWTRPLAWGALSGMEVSLAALLVAASLTAHARGRSALTAFLAALAALARPEALILLPLLVAAGPWSLRRVGMMLSIALLVLAPAVAFNISTVGGPMPATAAAKVEGGLLGWLAGVHEPVVRLLVKRPLVFFREWVIWLARVHWLLPIALLGALVAAWRRHGYRLGVPALALLVHPVAMAILAPFRGPEFQEGRYSMHLLSLALVLLAVAMSPMPPRHRAAAIVVYLALALPTLPAAAERYGWAVQNINAMQVHLGHWVDINLPRNARLALNDIGAITYVSRREVIDLMGLVTPEILPYRREGEEGVIRYVRERCPDYVIVFPAWFPLMTARPDLLEPIYSVHLDHNVVVGADEMVVYRLRRCAV
jgi:arabinofuranosyltransferase